MKGVSPVVATVLMVAVAIAAAVVAYSWFMSMQSQIQAEASRGASTVGKEMFSVEAVKCVDGDNDLNVWIRNLGDEEINGQFTFTIKNASTGTVLDVKRKNLYVAVGDTNAVTLQDVSGLNNCQITGDGDVIVVDVISPGGTSNSKKERI